MSGKRTAALRAAIESLTYFRDRTIPTYPNYPDEEFRRERTAEVNEHLTVLREMRDDPSID